MIFLKTKNMTTIAEYELDLTAVTKSLEQSRATYLSLQKKYQEQCSTYIGVSNHFFLYKKKNTYPNLQPPLKNTVMISDTERKQFAVSKMLPPFTKLTLSNGLENVKCMKNGSSYLNATSRFYRLRRHS